MIATKAAEDYKTISAETIEIKDLRVRFTVKKSLSKEPNTAEVTISNLSPSNRARLQTKGPKFALYVGYEGTGVKQIFQGDIRTVSHIHEGPTWDTVIKSGDGERAFQFARIEESFAAKIPLGQVVSRLTGKMGLGLGNTKQIASEMPGSFEQGLVVSGPVSRELDKVLAGTGYGWSIQDEQVVILKDSQIAGQEMPDIGPETGLIGSPEYGAPLVKGGAPLLLFRCLLNGNIKPGSQVKLTSDRYPKPVYVRIQKVDHSGDTDGGEWYSSCEGQEFRQ